MTTSPWDTSATWDTGALWQTTPIGAQAWPGLSTLDELKTAMGRYLQDEDFRLDYDLFIRQFEAEESTQLRLRCLETWFTFPVTDTMPLPAGFRGVRRLWVSGYPPLRNVDLEELADVRERYPAGPPEVFATVGQNLMIGPRVSGTYTANMVFSFQVPPLVAANPTNVLLASHPQLYLWGSLKHAELFLKNAEGVALYSGLYDAARMKAERAELREHRTYGPLTRSAAAQYRE